PLKYAAVDLVTPIVADLFSGSDEGTRMTADVRLNALIVAAKKDRHEKLQEVLERLDAPTESSDQVKAIPVEDEELRDATQVLRLLRGDVDVAVAQGMLVLRGKRESVDEASQLLKLLDQWRSEKKSKQPRPQATRDVTVEIIWLTESVMKNYIEYSGPASKVLKEKGFQRLSELGRLQVATLAGGSAEASGSVYGGQVAAEIEVESGKSPNDFLIQLKLDAIWQQSPIRFSSKLTTPLDRWVVFGIAASAPSDSDGMTPPKSVFLLRIKPQESLADDD
ncbi:MAG: hypothetical protein MI861_22105, partial [Pirellulales bacterium]|nr:hypothetical protein [Pirellulales bacterium]